MITQAHFDSQINQHFAVVNSLGQTVIIETFRAAAYYITHSNGSSTRAHGFNTEMREAHSCYVFVQGTGLQVLVDRFGLAYDAEQLKQTFNYCVRRSA